MEVIVALLWFAFWVWVLKGFYRWITGGIGRAFSGTWDSLFGNADAPAWQQARYERRLVENAPVQAQAAKAPLTGGLEAALQQDEASATRLARDIGENRRALLAAQKQSKEWRDKAEQAVVAGRDDLARAALGEAQTCDEAAAQAQGVIAELQPILDSYESEIRDLRRQLEDGKRRQMVADARIERARAGERAAQWLEPEGQEAIDRAAESYERQADLAEGQWEARKLGGGASGGGFGRKGVAAPAALPAPDQELLVPIETTKRWDAAIERQLAEIKERAGRTAA